MSTGITNIFTLMGSVFQLIIGNPLFSVLIGIVVVSIVVGIVTSVFSRRRGRARR